MRYIYVNILAWSWTLLLKQIFELSPFITIWYDLDHITEWFWNTGNLSLLDENKAEDEPGSTPNALHQFEGVQFRGQELVENNLLLH